MAVAVTGTLSAGSSDRQTKHNQEELPHVRGQGQKLGGSYARRAVAKRSYPASEVRGSSRECQAATAQEWLRGATPRPRSGVAARRSHPAPEARGGSREEEPNAHSQGWQTGGTTPRPRSSGCVGAGGPRGDIPR